jgi:hypothetical protein
LKLDSKEYFSIRFRLSDSNYLKPCYWLRHCKRNFRFLNKH